MQKDSRRFCIAPMIDFTDRHFRYMARLASQKATLFTEMITTGAILNGNQDFLLGHSPSEHPLVLQLGGSNPHELAQCATIGNQFGYDEINLNVGCPSDKVQHHKIGACLMAEPSLVRECLQAMAEQSPVPVTIKHRIGLDNDDSYDTLAAFVDQVQGPHCEVFYVHARNAILQGLSPKQNRQIPPLQYAKVYRLKQDFPHLQIIINGGIESLSDCQTHLSQVDGVMLGRAAYHNSALLLDVDQQIYATKTSVTRRGVVDGYLAYMTEQHAQGTAWHHMSKHLMGLFQGLPGARNMRRHLSENIHGARASLTVIEDALSLVDYDL
ncbi:MAG: tRNA dihydrouridine(20/20a) synthase DusA [Gammaproteobacteria bacterium]|jgi:tRNA-dihydrouridine synthase A|nr:tRNA dihydrouridine(20/20a) synthase DusA [Gammaproteobacteria bacterium]